MDKRDINPGEFVEEDDVVMTDTKPADVEEFKDDGVSAAFLRFDDIDEDKTKADQ
ncbi:hypothetical protein [Christensenella intestinihominis]|uniref:hypothetical protein n=1 Tax=Christensenella intestinihominis TaxID=1851429 RepID=UPI0012E9BE46|nr:hypothetical protein [Christensenella intestinihominis]